MRITTAQLGPHSYGASAFVLLRACGGYDYRFDDSKLEKFLGFIRTYYPGLDASRLHADYTGIRPKLYREGEPVPDFMVHGPETHGQQGLVMLFGIESPGLTASLAIAELVAERLAWA